MENVEFNLISNEDGVIRFRHETDKGKTRSIVYENTEDADDKLRNTVIPELEKRTNKKYDGYRFYHMVKQYIEPFKDKKDLFVLVACEESQAICKEFRKLGAIAYSCDLKSCSGGHPEWHIQGDCLPLIHEGPYDFETCDGIVHHVDKWDFIMAHPPCFVAGTQVICNDGVKNIEDVREGDYVLTHMGRFRKVYATMQHTVNKLSYIKTEQGDVICTPNHPFYASVAPFGVKGFMKKPRWITPSEFQFELRHSNKLFISRPISYLSTEFISKDAYEIGELCDSYINNPDMDISDCPRDFLDFISNGDIKIPGRIFGLGDTQGKEFIAGLLHNYMGDNEEIVYTTKNKNVAYTLQYMLLEYYKMRCEITHDNDNYVCKFNWKEKCYPINVDFHYFFYDKLVSHNTINVSPTMVYNLGVEEDESYTANGLAVHNCTYLTVSGNRWFNEDVYGDQATQRYNDREDAIKFFMEFVNASCDHIAIENPVGHMSSCYRKPDQIIEPWMFGDNHLKKTCLWIKGLPNIVPEVTEKPEIEQMEWFDEKTGKMKRQEKWYYEAFINAKTDEERQRIRSKTFPGIARAIAEQWYYYLTHEDEEKIESYELF